MTKTCCELPPKASVWLNVTRTALFQAFHRAVTGERLSLRGCWWSALAGWTSFLRSCRCTWDRFMSSGCLLSENFCSEQNCHPSSSINVSICPWCFDQTCHYTFGLLCQCASHFRCSSGYPAIERANRWPCNWSCCAVRTWASGCFRGGLPCCPGGAMKTNGFCFLLSQKRASSQTPE